MLAKVHAVQDGEVEVIRAIGLRQVLAEGLTPEGVLAFNQVMADFHETDRQLQDLRTAAAGLKKKVVTPDRQLARVVQAKLEARHDKMVKKRWPAEPKR